MENRCRIVHNEDEDEDDSDDVTIHIGLYQEILILSCFIYLLFNSYSSKGLKLISNWQSIFVNLLLTHFL